MLQRGAAGVTVLSLPGLLAACGGGGGGDGDGGELKDVLNFSNWTFYMDVEGKKHPTLDQFKAETGITVNYFEDVNSNDEYFAKVQGRLSQGQGIDRDIFVATDNSRFPGLYVDEGWVQPLDRSLIPNIDNLIEAQASPPFDPDRTYSLPWLGWHVGHRLERGPDRACHHHHAAARGLEAQGEGDDAQRDGRLARPRAARERGRPDGGHRRVVRPRYRQGPAGGRLGTDPSLHRQRLRTAAGQRRSGGRGCLVGRRRTTRRRQPEAEVGAAGAGRDHLDGQHVHPDGRQRADGVDVHELRLRPEDLCADRRRHELHHVASRA